MQVARRTPHGMGVRDPMELATTLSPVEQASLGRLWAEVDPAGAGRLRAGGDAAPRPLDALFARWRSPARGIRLVRSLAAHGVRCTRCTRAPEGFLVLHCRDPKERPWIASAAFDADGTVTRLSFGRAVPPGYRLRPLRQDEVELAATLVHDCPIVTGERSISVLQPRLRELSVMLSGYRGICAERESDGAVVALRTLALRTVVHEGRVGLLSVPLQAAVRADARGLALERALVEPLYAPILPACDWDHGYVDAGNAAILAAMGDTLPRWSHGIRQLWLRCDGDAAGEPGRVARPDDAPRLATLLAATHGGEALRPPLGEAWLRDRLGRIPSYGFGEVRLGERALLGVWPSGEEIVDASPAWQRRTRSALVADYGFEGEAGLAELLRLLAVARVRGGRDGLTHLVLYTSVGSPGAERLRALAEWDDEIAIVGTIPEAESAERTGIYTDPFYL